MREPLHSDVAVVGGGPSGALVALRLAQSGRRVVLLEARQADSPIDDARALALSWASRQRLIEVGAWPETLPVSLIDTVHVSQQGNWGRTVITAADTQLPHLGAVVDYPDLTRALDARLEAAGVTVLWGARVTRVCSMSRFAELQYTSATTTPQRLTCRLAVLAEGGALLASLAGIERRSFDYQQTALLAQVETDRVAPGVAYERFSKHGPLALLPHGNGYMLVWTRSHVDAARLQQLTPLERVAELQQALGERMGRVLSVSAPAAFPLAMRRASQVVSGRIVLIGNAAQTLHPVAAQGLNLGIRDACGLAQHLEGASDPGDAQVLAAYARSRRLDTSAVVGFTHGLMRVTESQAPWACRVRALGMNLLDTIPPLRRRFAGYLVFGVGVAS
jgi:2-octaprenyl-6-methoxyphenol hydroxylase